MALTTDQKTSLLFKKWLGKGETTTLRQFFEEPFSGRSVVLQNQIWTDSEDIPTTAPVLADGADNGIVKYYEDLALTPVAGTTNSFQSDGLKDAIPFNYGDGTYNYYIKDHLGSYIPFGQGEWIVDTEAGTLTFYGDEGAPDYPDLSGAPTISFYQYIGRKGGGTGDSLWYRESIGSPATDNATILLNNADTVVIGPFGSPITSEIDFAVNMHLYDSMKIGNVKISNTLGSPGVEDDYDLMIFGTVMPDELKFALGTGVNEIVDSTTGSPDSIGPWSTDDQLVTAKAIYNAISSNVDGTGSNGQVAYWNSSNTITGESDFTWDAVNNRLNVPFIQFDTSVANGFGIPGLLHWNLDELTLDLGLTPNVTLQIGQEMHMLVKNQTGSQIDNGTAVMFAGTIGASGRILAAPTVADGTYPSIYMIGIATEDIPNGSDGFVSVYGKIRGLDTSMWNDGDILWLDPSTPGGLTNVKPDAPNLKTSFAAVVHSDNTQGVLFVRPTLHSSVGELNDVNISASPLTQYDILIHDTDKWYNIDYRELDEFFYYYTIAEIDSMINVGENQVAVGTGSPATLEGTADFTWDGSILDISGSHRFGTAGLMINDSRGLLIGTDSYAGTNVVLSTYGAFSHGVPTDIQGNYNVYIGHDGLSSSATGSQNVMIGWYAGYNLTTGWNNIFIGQSAGEHINAGYTSIAIGQQSGDNNEGHHNVNLGAQLVGYGSQGDHNTYIGTQRSGYRVTGSRNVVIGGEQALYGDTSGMSASYAIAIGDFAGNYMDGNYNIAIGALAGAGATGGNYSVYIGPNVGQNYSTSDHTILIDTQYRASGLYLIKANGASQDIQFNATVNINNAYDLPTADGTINYVMATDGAGTAYWADVDSLSNELFWQRVGTVVSFVYAGDTLRLQNAGSPEDYTDMYTDASGDFYIVPSTGLIYLGSGTGINEIVPSGTSPDGIGSWSTDDQLVTAKAIYDYIESVGGGSVVADTYIAVGTGTGITGYADFTWANNYHYNLVENTDSPSAVYIKETFAPDNDLVLGQSLYVMEMRGENPSFFPIEDRIVKHTVNPGQFQWTSEVVGIGSPDSTLTFNAGTFGATLSNAQISLTQDPFNGGSFVANVNSVGFTSNSSFTVSPTLVTMGSSTGSNSAQIYANSGVTGIVGLYATDEIRAITVPSSLDVGFRFTHSVPTSVNDLTGFIFGGLDGDYLTHVNYGMIYAVPTDVTSGLHDSNVVFTHAVDGFQATYLNVSLNLIETYYTVNLNSGVKIGFGATEPIITQVLDSFDSIDAFSTDAQLATAKLIYDYVSAQIGAENFWQRNSSPGVVSFEYPGDTLRLQNSASPEGYTDLYTDSNGDFNIVPNGGLLYLPYGTGVNEIVPSAAGSPVSIGSWSTDDQLATAAAVYEVINDQISIDDNEVAVGTGTGIEGSNSLTWNDVTLTVQAQGVGAPIIYMRSKDGASYASHLFFTMLYEDNYTGGETYAWDMAVGGYSSDGLSMGDLGFRRRNNPLGGTTTGFVFTIDNLAPLYSLVIDEDGKLTLLNGTGVNDIVGSATGSPVGIGSWSTDDQLATAKAIYDYIESIGGDTQIPDNQIAVGTGDDIEGDPNFLWTSDGTGLDIKFDLYSTRYQFGEQDINLYTVDAFDTSYTRLQTGTTAYSLNVVNPTNSIINSISPTLYQIAVASGSGDSLFRFAYDYLSYTNDGSSYMTATFRPNDTSSTFRLYVEETTGEYTDLYVQSTGTYLKYVNGAIVDQITLNATYIDIYSTQYIQARATSPDVLYLYNDTPVVAAGGETQQLFLGDSGSGKFTYAKIFAKSTSISTGSQAGKLVFSVSEGGSNVDAFEILQDQSLVHHVDGVDWKTYAGTPDLVIATTATSLSSNIIISNLEYWSPGYAEGISSNGAQHNVAIGTDVMNASASGDNNVLIGRWVGYNLTTGSGNTYLGYQAGGRNPDGTRNVAVGYDSGVREGGNNNVDIGNATGNSYQQASGNNLINIGYYAGHQYDVTTVNGGHTNTNTISIGYEAGKWSDSDYSVFLGNRVGYLYTSGNYKIFIDTEYRASADYLISGDGSARALQLNATVNINGAYDLPTADGSTNYVMTTDGAGTAYWADVDSLNPNYWQRSGSPGIVSFLNSGDILRLQNASSPEEYVDMYTDSNGDFYVDPAGSMYLIGTSTTNPELIIRNTDNGYKQTFRTTSGALQWLWGNDTDEDGYMSIQLTGGDNILNTKTRDFLFRSTAVSQILKLEPTAGKISLQYGTYVDEIVATVAGSPTGIGSWSTDDQLATAAAIYEYVTDYLEGSGGLVVIPQYQIVYGTGTGITSDEDMYYQANLDSYGVSYNKLVLNNISLDFYGYRENFNNTLYYEYSHETGISSVATWITGGIVASGLDTYYGGITQTNTTLTWYTYSGPGVTDYYDVMVQAESGSNASAFMYVDFEINATGDGSYNTLEIKKNYIDLAIYDYDNTTLQIYLDRSNKKIITTVDDNSNSSVITQYSTYLNIDTDVIVTGTFEFDAGTDVNEIVPSPFGSPPSSPSGIGAWSTDDQLVTAKAIYDYIESIGGSTVIADNQIAVGTGSGIEGDPDFTWSGTALQILEASIIMTYDVNQGHKFIRLNNENSGIAATAEIEFQTDVGNGVIGMGGSGHTNYPNDFFFANTSVTGDFRFFNNSIEKMLVGPSAFTLYNNSSGTVLDIDMGTAGTEQLIFYRDGTSMMSLSSSIAFEMNGGSFNVYSGGTLALDISGSPSGGDLVIELGDIEGENNSTFISIIDSTNVINLWGSLKMNSTSQTVNAITTSVTSGSLHTELPTALAVWNAISGLPTVNYYLSSVDASDISAVNFTLAGGGPAVTDVDFTHALSTHTDVSITGSPDPDIGDILVWSGSAWVNQPEFSYTHPTYTAQSIDLDTTPGSPALSALVIDTLVITSNTLGHLTGASVTTRYLTPEDIGAEPALTKGDLTSSTTDQLTVSNGTNAVIGSGTSISVVTGPIASGSTDLVTSETIYTYISNLGLPVADNQIVVGTGAGVEGDTDFTWDSSTNVFAMVGSIEITTNTSRTWKIYNGTPDLAIGATTQFAANILISNFEYFTPGYLDDLAVNGAEYNIAIGTDVMNASASGDNNVLIGRWVGYNLTTGSGNTYLGYQAGGRNPDGIRNVAIGYDSGVREGGDNNVDIGNAAGNGYTQASGSNLINIGYYAGHQYDAAALLGGHTNDKTISIGYEAGKYADSNNSVFIGTGVGKEWAGGNNWILIDTEYKPSGDYLIKANGVLASVEINGSLALSVGADVNEILASIDGSPVAIDDLSTDNQLATAAAIYEFVNTSIGALPSDIYLTGGSFGTSTGELTLTRSASQSDIVIDLDGRYALQEIFDDMKEPNGFVDTNAYSNISFDDGTLTFTVEPKVTSFSFYSGNIKYTKTSAQTKTISDIEGMWYFYFDSNGDLQTTQTWNINLITLYAYVAAVYWDATNSQHIYMGDERHGINMDSATHRYLHTTNGAQFLDGLALADITADGNGNSDIHAQLSYESGSIADEDIIHTIAGKTIPASIPMFYVDGSSPPIWRRVSGTGFVVTTAGTGRAAYNDITTGSLVEATNGNYILSHFFATNDPDQGIIIIIGQGEYLNAAEARAAATEEIYEIFFEGLPLEEFTPIGTVIIQTRDNYNNTVKSRIVSTDEGGDWIDWRFTVLGGSAGASGTVTSHGLLTGLGDDDHLQYALLAGRTGGQTLYGSNAAGEDLTLIANPISGGTINFNSNIVLNSTIEIASILDEDNMISDSDTALATQQSIKAYVDNEIGALVDLDEKVKISAADTTAGYLFAKVTSSDSTIDLAISGGGGDEDLNITFAHLLVTTLDANNQDIDNVKDLYVNQYVYHYGDTNTFISFAINQITAVANGNAGWDFNDASLIINGDEVDRDFIVRTSASANSFHVDGNTGYTAINKATASYQLDITGTANFDNQVRIGEGLYFNSIPNYYYKVFDIYEDTYKTATFHTDYVQYIEFTNPLPVSYVKAVFRVTIYTNEDSNSVPSGITSTVIAFQKNASDTIVQNSVFVEKSIGEGGHNWRVGECELFGSPSQLRIPIYTDNMGSGRSLVVRVEIIGGDTPNKFEDWTLANEASFVFPGIAYETIEERLGIGYASDVMPQYTLDVSGNTFTQDLIVENSLQYIHGASNGYVLTSDASGNATWEPLSTSGGVSGTGVSGQVTYWNGTNSVTGATDFTWDGNLLKVNTSATPVGSGYAIFAGGNIAMSSTSFFLTWDSTNKIYHDSIYIGTLDYEIYKWDGGAEESVIFIDNTTGSGSIITIGDQLKFTTGATINTIQTTITDIDTAVPTSSAVVDYVNSLGFVNTVTSPYPADNQVAVFVDQDTLEGSSNFTYNGTSLNITATSGTVLNLTSSSNQLRVTDVDDGKYFSFNMNIGTFSFYNGTVSPLQISHSATSNSMLVISTNTVYTSVDTYVNANLDAYSFSLNGGQQVDDIVVSATSPDGIGSWSLDTELATAKAIYDYIESLGIGSGTIIPDNQIAVGTGTGIEGDTNFTWDGSGLAVVGNISLPDYVVSTSGYLYLGDSDDLQIYHTGTTSIVNATTSDLWLSSVSNNIIIKNGLTSTLTASSSGITLASGATVNDIQTTISDIDTAVPTSGAVVDYVTGFGISIADNYIAVGTGTGIEGTSALTYDGTTLYTSGELNVLGDVTLGTVGSGTETVIELNQTTNYIDLYAGGTLAFHLTSSGLQLETGATVNEIQTTISDTDSAIPTSGAVVDYITSLGYVDVVGTPAASDNQIAVFTDSNTIEGDPNFTWNGTVMSITSTVGSALTVTTNQTVVATFARNSGLGALIAIENTDITWVVGPNGGDDFLIGTPDVNSPKFVIYQNAADDSLSINSTGVGLQTGERVNEIVGSASGSPVGIGAWSTDEQLATAAAIYDFVVGYTPITYWQRNSTVVSFENDADTLRLQYDGSNYTDMYTDSSGNAFFKSTNRNYYFANTGGNNTMYVFDYTSGSNYYSIFSGSYYRLIDNSINTVNLEADTISFMHHGLRLGDTATTGDGLLQVYNDTKDYGAYIENVGSIAALGDTYGLYVNNSRNYTSNNSSHYGIYANVDRFRTSSNTVYAMYANVNAEGGFGEESVGVYSNVEHLFYAYATFENSMKAFVGRIAFTDDSEVVSVSGSYPAYGMLLELSVPTNKTLDTYYGLYIDSPTGAGAVTNLYGIYQESADAINVFNGEIRTYDFIKYMNSTGIIMYNSNDNPVIVQESATGAMSFGGDEGVYIGSGEARGQTVSNTTVTSEDLHLSSDRDVFIRTEIQNGWGSHFTFTFDGDGYLTLPQDPTLDLHAVTKQYVDNLVTGITTAPTAPTNLVLTETTIGSPGSPGDAIGVIEVEFDVDDTNDSYEIWMSQEGPLTGFDMVGKIKKDSITSGSPATVSIYDDTWTRKATIYYRVYAKKNGITSDALTGNITPVGNVDDVSTLTIDKYTDFIVLQWNNPLDRRLDYVEIKVDVQAVEGNLAEGNATSVYTGMGEVFVYKIDDADLDKYFQFWVYTITRT